MTADVRTLDEVEPAPSVVTIGFFDGVHRGHRAIIARAVTRARERGVRAVIVTFDVHPRSVVSPDQVPPLLQTRDDRLATLAEQGAELVVVLGFTPEFSRRSPDEFVEEVLAGRLRAVEVVVGANFRFGHRATGDVVALAALGERHGFELDAVELLEGVATTVSSSMVRAAVADGDVALATDALGRPPLIRGTVVRGDGRGATIGVPTANLRLLDGLIEPGTGVYAGRARPEGDEQWAPAVINVGTRPTFAGQDVRVEVHLLDVERELYDRELAVELRHRLRDEQRFDGVTELVAQIRADIGRARGLLA